MADIGDELVRIRKTLEHIEQTLQNLPEVEAAVYLRMMEQYRAAQLQGRKADDIWVIAQPNLR